MAKRYKVTVEELREGQEEERYPSHDTIYEQSVDNLELINVIIAVNAIGAMTPEPPKEPSPTSLDPADDEPVVFKEEQPPRNGKLIKVKEEQNEQPLSGN